jgi:succinyl-CoA synthetase beta subunit
MKLIEADGKKILKEAGINVPFNCLLKDVKTFPVYLKAQLLQGRRGKRGLVRRCSNREELDQAIIDMTAALKDAHCSGFICEQEIIHKEQWFVAMDIDRAAGKIRINFSDEGGMGVEKARSSTASSDNEIANLDLPSCVMEVVRKMYSAFQKNDALNIEINPLVLLPDGSCVALDAKIELDDAAAFRHPEWASFSNLTDNAMALSEREETYAHLQSEAGHRGTLGRYVELDGDIALILSGGGASLVAMDALKRAGGRPANYVEMSGNPDPEQVRKATAIVLSKPGIRAIWIAGSFANFTDIRSTVNAVLCAIKDAGLRVPVVIRRDGPNAEAAKTDATKWAEEQGVVLRFDRADTDLDSSANAVVAASQV